MKLLPQYSLRLMLVITALVAAAFSIVGLAVRGHGWAIGVSVGIAGVAGTLVTYAAFFGILWVFSVVASPIMDRPLRPGRTTFAGATSPFGQPAAALKPESAIIIDETISKADGTADSVGGDG